MKYTPNIGRLRGIALLPILIFALTVTAQSKSKVMEHTEVEVDTINEPVSIADGNINQWAHFSGGETEFYKFLQDSIRYPEELVKSGVKGRVDVQFTIGGDGVAKDFIIVKSLMPAADAEVLRVFKTMPKWIPQIEYDKPKEVKFVMSINFQMDEEEETDKETVDQETD